MGPIRGARLSGCAHAKPLTRVARYALLVGAIAVTWGSVLPVACGVEDVRPKAGIVLNSSVEALAVNPEKYLGRTVQVSGRLENMGKNYFTDLRVVLRDDGGNSVYVIPWLPVELPPSPPGASKARPPTLSQYLDKTVKLIAVLERATLKGVGGVYSLRVQSAEII